MKLSEKKDDVSEVMETFMVGAEDATFANQSFVYKTITTFMKSQGDDAQNFTVSHLFTYIENNTKLNAKGRVKNIYQLKKCLKELERNGKVMFSESDPEVVYIL